MKRVTIHDIITRAGGQSALARMHGIPLRTIQNWAGGQRHPPDWLVRLLDKETPGCGMPADRTICPSGPSEFD